jgi:hypothetical protein
MALTKLSSAEFQTGAITTDKFSGDVALSVRIANVSIANSTYTVLDDTAVNVGGGYIVVTGAGFQSGAQIVINETPATSTTFVSSTELRAQIGAKSAATYDVYVINPDGGNAISVNGITYSTTPTWVTGSTLNAQNVDVAFNVSFSATGATSYANTTALPAGTTLLSNGYFYGTVTGIESETTYNFTIRATDAENQDSDREFSLTVAVAPPVSATGGTITTDGSYTVHTFTSSGNFVVSQGGSVEYLVVAGGGGGGENEFGLSSGGGGAGGYRTGNTTVTTTTYTVTIGAGGTIYGDGQPGTNSSFGSISSTGGGGGGKWGPGRVGGPGGSGGGKGQNGTAYGLGNYGGYTPPEGYDGSEYSATGNDSGGGGGAGAAASGQSGGLGRTFYGVTYATGGNGSTGGVTGSSGAPNTGDGGENGPRDGPGYGGSGIVIIRYKT